MKPWHFSGDGQRTLPGGAHAALEAAEFMSINNYPSADLIPPDEFVTWVFPELFKSRIPRYQAIADEYGYTVDANDVAKVTNEDDFIRLITDALAKQS